MCKRESKRYLSKVEYFCYKTQDFIIVQRNQENWFVLQFYEVIFIESSVLVNHNQFWIQTLALPLIIRLQRHHLNISHQGGKTQDDLKIWENGERYQVLIDLQAPWRNYLKTLAFKIFSWLKSSFCGRRFSLSQECSLSANKPRKSRKQLMMNKVQLRIDWLNLPMTRNGTYLGRNIIWSISMSSS